MPDEYKVRLPFDKRGWFSDEAQYVTIKVENRRDPTLVYTQIHNAMLDNARKYANLDDPAIRLTSMYAKLMTVRYEISFYMALLRESQLDRHVTTLLGNLIQTMRLANITCFVMAGIGHVTQVLLDCHKKLRNQGSSVGPISIVNCMKRKGYNIAISMAGAAISCMASY
ncbi:hypothetical protein [Hahella ganghwensis]|uniref:hypothetical protein n=1 Tax=Hahella ganghwensis TaxID=286420 RepID=UPI0003804C30|nr:hypothetical protein [Hahella ganghwensis]